jgi:two-component system response regulator HydG
MPATIEQKGPIARLTISSKPSKEIQTSTISFVGHRRRLEQLRHHLMLCGPTEARIVITGETGTGKTSIARALHFMHPTRGARNFRRTNIGALVPELAASQLFGHVKGAFTGAERDHKGIVEESNLGTLFLDEVSTAADVVQVMLLTLLENNTVNRVGAEPADRC